MSTLADMRRDYRLAELSKDLVAIDPIEQFRRWFEAATVAEVPEPNAMTLATVDADGHPAARIVLLKAIEPQGIVFYTNYHSAKGQHLAHLPRAAAVFWWQPLERQVRFGGRILKLSAASSDEYFNSRPRDSQIGAAASPQSAVIASRQVLEQRFKQLHDEAGDKPIPRPPHWGGYRLEPDSVEFWQGRSSRLHDRLRYRRQTGQWIIERLAP